MRMNPSDILLAAQQAGFTGDDLIVAGAVAYAESGGDPAAYNPEIAAGSPAGQGSFGLWQIYLHAHPEFTGKNLFDVATNGLAAFSLYRRSGGFRPWTTYKTGAYLQWMPVMMQAISPAPAVDQSGPPDQAVPDQASPDTGNPALGWVGIAGAGILLAWIFAG